MVSLFRSEDFLPLIGGWFSPPLAGRMIDDYQPHIVDVLINRWCEVDSTYATELPVVRNLHKLPLHPHVTFFIGENGSGKSTLLEAIAVADGFNAEGGTRNFNFESRSSHSDLYKWIRLSRGVRGKRRKDGFFARAESFYNVATEIERLGVGYLYGDSSLHEMSHGEAFLALMTTRLTGDGLYLFDEPEAALSPQRQLAFLAAMHQLVAKEAQFIIATHSPIIMAYPNAWIYRFGPEGIQRVAYEDTEHYRVTRTFLDNPQRTFRHLFDDGEPIE